MSTGHESPDNGAIRELRDNVKELNKTIKYEVGSQRRFTLAFAGLALVQITIAVGQLGVEVIPSNFEFIRIVIFTMCLGVSGYIFYLFFNDTKES